MKEKRKFNEDFVDQSFVLYKERNVDNVYN